MIVKYTVHTALVDQIDRPTTNHGFARGKPLDGLGQAQMAELPRISPHAYEMHERRCEGNPRLALLRGS